MSNSLTLYTNPMSRGRIARWMLEEVGVQYETEYLEYGTSMKAPEYLKINPAGKVPAIKHGDVVVTECPAICAYLADVFPEAQLGPTDQEKGAYYRWLFYFAGPVEAVIVNRSLQVEVPEDKRSTVGYGHYDNVISTIEAAISSGGDYIAGNRFTAADVYTGSHIGWGMQFGTIEKRPVFEQYYARLSDREAFRRANELDDAAMPTYDTGK